MTGRPLSSCPALLYNKENIRIQIPVKGDSVNVNERNSLRPSQTARKLHFPAPAGAFLLTALLLLALFMLLGFYPFGEHSILASDLAAQYAPDLVAYKQKLLSGGNLSYSFLIGMGKNTLGLFAYYLSSPLSFVTFLFPAENISEAVLVLITLKLSLASAFFSLLLRKRFRTESGYAVLFGVLYAFSSYVMVYMINIMWLDGLLLLPLLLYFIERYLENRKHWPWVTLTLLVLFVSGFYIAYMAGIFSFLYLVYRLAEEKRFASDTRKESGKAVLLFLGCAALAAAMSMAVLLPAGLDILGNPDHTARSGGLDSNFKLISLLNQILCGSFDSLSNNKPLIYCGLPVLFLILLFFLNPNFPKRKKRLTGGVLAFFLLSFNLSYLDLAWQLFDSPNWFLYRYSFLFILVCLMIAFDSLLQIRSLTPRSFLIVLGAFFGLLIVVQGFGDLGKDGTRFYLNVLVGGLELFMLYLLTLDRFPAAVANLKKLVPVLFGILLCCEVAVVNPMLIRPKILGGETERDKTYNAIQTASKLVSTAREDAGQNGYGFYRMETDGTILGGIDPMTAGLYLGYPSISTFNSSANKDLNRFLKQLGFETNYNYFTSCHNYSSPAADSLLGIRYVLADAQNFAGYTSVAESADGKLSLYRNDSVLPLMFAVKADAGSFDFYSQETDTSSKDPFRFQNELFQSLFGGDLFSRPVYYPEEAAGPEIYNAIEMDPSTVSPDENESESISEASDRDLLGSEPYDKLSEYGTTYMRINDASDLMLTYTLTASDDNPLFLSIPSAARSSQADIYVNGEYLGEASSSAYTRIYSLGSYKAGEKVMVEIRADSDTYSLLQVLFYHLDTDLFERQLTAASGLGQVAVTGVSDGYAAADVEVSEDALLLTSIPYEKGWTLLVDGQKTEITPYQNALIAVPVTAGKHTVRLTFTAPGLAAGTAVSAGAALVFAAAWIVSAAGKRNKK